MTTAFFVILTAHPNARGTELHSLPFSLVLISANRSDFSRAQSLCLPYCRHYEQTCLRGGQS